GRLAPGRLRDSGLTGPRRSCSRGIRIRVSWAPSTARRTAPRALDQVTGGFRPCSVPELESGGGQQARDDSPALEQQLGIGADGERAELRHPPGSRKPGRDAPRSPQFPHEVTLPHGPGGGEVDRPRQAVVVKDETDRGGEVVLVDPGHVL